MFLLSRSMWNATPAWWRVIAIATLAALFPFSAVAQPARAADQSPREADRPSGVDYSWRDGETTFHFGAGELALTNRIQFRGTDRRDPAVSAGREFDIPRARTELSGWIVVEHLTYEVQVDWAEGPELQDLFVGVDLSRRGTIVVKAGQFKVPSSRQRLTSSGELQFVDRSIAAGEFTDGRDIGVEVSGDIARDRLEYRAGVFNGAGQNTLAKPGGLQYNGRLTYQPFGAVDYSESDVQRDDDPRFAIGGYAEVHDRPPLVSAGDRVVVGGDVALFYRGLSVLGELYLRTLRDLQTPARRSGGFLIQAGYFVLPQRLEVAGRVATLDRQAWSPGGGDRELGVAVGYFLNRHNLKLQADVRRLKEPLGDSAAHEFRTQLQVVF